MRIPTSDEIVVEAIAELNIGALPREEARASFDAIMRGIGDRTLLIYERYEHARHSAGLPDRVLNRNPELLAQAGEASGAQGFRAGAVLLLTGLYTELRKEFLSIAQSRKSRGGKSFEMIFEHALQLCGFPYDKQHTRLHTDFTMPSHALFDRNWTICAVVSLKRTLRERWQEVAGEMAAKRCPNVFLATADDSVSPGAVKGICDDNGLHLVVWDAIKREKYAGHPRVLGYTQFANERIPNLMQIWNEGQ